MFDKLAQERHTYFENQIDAIIYDRCTVHSREDFNSFLEVCKTPLFLIPTYCAGLLQPLDVFINRTL